ncbi:MAG: Radical SAM protein [uncultured Sulfurovum sp.]|uniref:Radical SAM protein n=1 Tax=uncultured Sulfurovum sp. TaxID=269237 RepID=A0A6S6TQF9_9BACT|nr:MAG: Radical SAM protein [uncultured Sulfurovum sp.]
MSQNYYHVTLASNFIKGFDKYKKRYSKVNLKASTFPEQFFVLKRNELSIGIDKATKLLNKLGNREDFLIVLVTNIGDLETYNDHETGLAQYLKQNYIDLLAVYTLDREKSFIPMRIEELTAKSFELNFDLEKNYETIRPRSISILPVKSGCQAKCDFCFSTYSVSEDLEKGLLENNSIERYLKLAKEKGASRAVITGGGEPTLIAEHKLLDMVKTSALYFPHKVVLISNAHTYAIEASNEIVKKIQALKEHGLTDLSISRHHYDDVRNEAIMKLHTPIENILELKKSGLITLNIRLIAVLQKGAIDSKEEIKNYLDWAGSFGVEQICFKELYVSTSSESYYHEFEANEFSYSRQVPLALVLEFCHEHGFKKVSELPWGAPVYEGKFNGNYFSIAAYTEPSLYWELVNGLSRSWNLMSNGDCLASLEDKHSFVEAQDIEAQDEVANEL